MYELRALTDFRLAYKHLVWAKPIFMQVASTNPTLWFEQGSSINISLHGVLVSPQVEMMRFAAVDIIMATMFGLPHLVPWDVTLLPNMSRLAVFSDWIPGCPPDFIAALAIVNTWRAQDVLARDTNEWRRVEAYIKDCHPHNPTKTSNLDSFQTIARRAVQEAYRHMALIYLYMVRRLYLKSDLHCKTLCILGGM